MSQRKHVIVLLDNSYSMFRVTNKTVNGLNAFVQTLQKRSDAKTIYMSIISFSNKLRYVCKCIPVQTVANIQAQHLGTMGMTHLYDAISSVIMEWSIFNHKHHLFVISDGNDVGSVNYTNEQTKKLMSEATSHGWDITHCDVDTERLVLPATKQIVYNIDEIDQLFSEMSI